MPFEVEVVCSDRDEHRLRIEERTSDLAGLSPPSWQDITRLEDEVREDARIVVDSAGRASEESYRTLRRPLK